MFDQLVTKISGSAGRPPFSSFSFRGIFVGTVHRRDFPAYGVTVKISADLSRLYCGRLAIVQWFIAGPVVGILGLAAVIAWVVVVSIPSVHSLLKTDVVRAGLLRTSVATDLAEQNGVSAKVAKESGDLLEPTSRSDPSEVIAVAPAPSMPLAPGLVPPSAPNRTIPDFVTRQLDPDELASMRQRADDFIKSGDLSSARLLLERGAEAGDARATLMLAGTFDPNVLKTLGFQEGAADIATARFWYDRAQKLDAAEAPRRIQELATVSQ